MTPIKRKKIKRASSRRDAFRVIPRICRPFECRDSLNILYTVCIFGLKSMVEKINGEKGLRNLKPREK